MWEQYFPSADIYGIDLHTYPEFPGGRWRARVRVFQADQSKPNDLLTVMQHIGCPLDFVSDDGSHRTDDQITALKTLYPFLAKGGIYVIEDISNIEDIKPHLSGYNHWFAVPNSVGSDNGGTIMAIIQK